MSVIKKFFILISGLSLTACCANNHCAVVPENKISVATVQKYINVGQSSADVVQFLGSPNIVSTDSNRCETWVYDKVATESSYERRSGVLGLAAGGGVLGLIGINGSSGLKKSNQKTLTIVVKFDKNHTVCDYSYHTTTF